METLARELGVKIETNANVEKIDVTNGKATGILVNNKIVTADIVLSGADYHHSETLLEKNYRQYSENYWENKTFAPSSLLFYVGFDKKIENVEHHSLFFDVDFDVHAEAIYDHPKWPENPLFYASFPSKTDASSAPEGKEYSVPSCPCRLHNTLPKPSEKRRTFTPQRRATQKCPHSCTAMRMIKAIRNDAKFHNPALIMLLTSRSVDGQPVWLRYRWLKWTVNH
jgi:phytoene dehydrogenase-like protein